MFTFYRTARKAEPCPKVFEVYVKEVRRGVFVTQTVAVCVGSVNAPSLAEANRIALALHGRTAYAVGRLSD